jgi:transcriptional regulator with XRE-family HTH domain
MQINSNDIDVHVGQRMRQLRESLGLSQGRLGRQLGLTFSQVQKYEKGANRIGAGRLYILAGLLDVPIQYFFEEIGARPDRLVERRPASASRAEVRELEEAFLSIPDDSTRRSLVALVRSLAGPGGDPAAVIEAAVPERTNSAHG